MNNQQLSHEEFLEFLVSMGAAAIKNKGVRYFVTVDEETSKVTIDVKDEERPKLTKSLRRNWPPI